MAWPPSQGSTTFTARGSAITTLAWGTDGLNTDSNIGNAILKSIRSSEMVEEIKVDNGTGLTAVLVGLKDGTEVELTCEDDRSITWPSFMGTVTILDPRPTGSSGTSTLFQVINNNFSGARKQNGERVILAKKYTLITPS